MPRINIPTVGEVDFPDGMSDGDISAAIQKNYPQLSKPAPSTIADVAWNAANKGAASLPDAILNTPNNLLNLGKAAVGTVATAAGRPDLAPELAPNHDFARRGMEAIGMIKPNIQPQGFVQKGIDYGVQGAVGGALTGGASNARILAGAGLGGLSGEAAGATAEMGGSPAAVATAGMLTPAGVGAIPKISAGATSVMQSALKPSVKSLEKGDAARAIQTMLDEGINVSAGGVQKLKDKINVLNADIVKEIGASPAIIDKSAVYGPVKEALDKFTKQANPNADTASIRKAWDEFVNHPSFEPMKRQEASLIAAIEQKQASKISALQDAGRFQTMAAQQKNLAGGGEVRLSPNQPVNSPEMNVGATGGRSVSPSAYPPSGPGTNVRFPERYTENIQRVPEATQAHADAMAIVKRRQLELDKAVDDYQKFKTAGGAGIPVQLAQELKQGTYRILDKKYGQVSTAEDEGQKAIARGLKEQVAKAVPEVSGLNAKESELINALKLVERRSLQSGNKNTLGLAPIAPNSLHALSFLLDRSPLATSLLARSLNGMNDHGILSQVSQQTSPIVTQGILADIHRRQQ